MERALLTVLAGMVFMLQSSAAPLDPARLEHIRTLTLDGLHLAYNLDFTNANKKFDEAIALEPLHPRPYVSKAAPILWKFLMGRSDNDYKELLEIGDRTIEIAEKYLDQYGEDADVLICLGTAYGYRAFAHGRAKSYLKAAWDGKRSYDYFYDALKLDPQAYDAYLGLGVFHYVTAFLPKALQWVVSILGISGDSNSGLRELQLASEKGVYSRIEAKYFFAQFLPWQHGDFETSEKLLSELHAEYPDNALLTFTVAVWEIRRNDVRSARDRLLSILHSPNEALTGLKRFTRYKLAECYFRLNDFTQAREHYQTFLKEHKEEAYQGTANYRVGLCFELSGKRDSAVAYYRRATQTDRKFGDDAYSSRKAGQRLASRLSAPDTLFITAQNALRSGDYDGAAKLFTLLKDQQSGANDFVAEATFGLADALFEKGLYHEALEHYQAISDFPLSSEMWLYPWSHYQSGLSYLKLGDPIAAKREFEKVREYDDYDFYNWLGFRTERELEKLK